MDSVNYLLIGSAALALVGGLSLHFWSVSGRGRPHFHTTTSFAWLLIALFPVLVLFSLFPGSQIEGTVLGVSAGGAVCLFLVIWVYGPRRSRAGRTLDDLNEKIRTLQGENSDLQGKVAGMQSAKPKARRHEVRRYSIRGQRGRFVDIVTGDLTEVRECECWVNSENTYMQMARVFERSISAVIRYRGSRRDAAGDVVDDIIADQLAAAVGGAKVVQPASVFLTSAGELAASHGVQVIAHVASVTGQVGVGWKPIDGIHRCVSAVLRAVDSSEMAKGVKSVLFPLMGTGQAADNQERGELARSLIAEAVDYLKENPGGRVERVCFLAWSDVDLEACDRAIRALPELEPA